LYFINRKQYENPFFMIILQSKRVLFDLEFVYKTFS
jgi:hypothetical protein